MAALVLVLVAAGGVFAKIQHDANVKATAAEQAQQEEADAQAAQDASDDQERDARHDMVKELQKNITKTARKAVRTGVLDGPIKYSSCTATGGGSTDDLTALTGTFECIAVNKENKDDTVSGYGYTGTIDWESGEISWRIRQ